MNATIRAITFDLDDTLWPFAPIGERIETALHDIASIAEDFDSLSITASSSRSPPFPPAPASIPMKPE